ncbi:MAG: hypothetical protein IKP68_05570 [Clostridia bacterium]|nr:hypothetical protein [Clostridia bacterium]
MITTATYATDRNDTESFTVSISSYSGIQSGSVSINYDSSIVEIESGTLSAPGSFMSSFTPSNGMGVFAYTSAVSFGGDVLTFTVRVKDNAEIGASCQITATVTLEPEVGDNIVENVTLGTITVTCSHTGSTTNVDAVPATCQSVGYTADVKCDVCGEFISGHEQISKSDHTYGAWVDDQNGTTHTHTCTECGTESETENHTWNAGVVTTAPTCVAKGVKTYTCTKCGATKTEDVDPTGVHTYGNWVDDQNGTTHTHTCTVCGTNKETEDHAWNAGVVTTAPTCVAKGTKTYTCTVCGATKTEDVDPTGVHTWGSWVDDQNGTTHTHTCTVCGTNKETEDHVWNAGVVTKTPTCVAKGVKTYTCTKCGATKTEDINPTGVHTYDNDCDKTCNVCEQVRETTHKFAEVWSSDGTSHWHVCTVCGLKADVAEHVPGKEATETEPQVCVVCGYILKQALGHTHKFGDEWKYDETSHWHACTSGDGATSDLSAHTFGSWKITQKSVDKNERTRHCTVCGYTETEEYTPKTYNILDGGNSTWTPTSGGGLSVRSEADIKDFVGVMVDDELVDPKYYTVTEGSTIVTFTDEFLKTLSEGTHTIAILSIDGVATTDVTVSTNPESTQGTTGTSTTRSTTGTQQGETTNGGCGSFIGVASAMTVLIATLGAAIVIKRKR